MTASGFSLGMFPVKARSPKPVVRGRVQENLAAPRRKGLERSDEAGIDSRCGGYGVSKSYWLFGGLLVFSESCLPDMLTTAATTPALFKNVLRASS